MLNASKKLSKIRTRKYTLTLATRMTCFPSKNTLRRMVGKA